jgi:hypothetical protein
MPFFAVCCLDEVDWNTSGKLIGPLIKLKNGSLLVQVWRDCLIHVNVEIGCI